MEEDQYRKTYRSLNPLQCPFEKTLNSRRCQCAQMERFCLADREGVACRNESAWLRCKNYLTLMRDKAKFALKLTQVDGVLPHGKEIKVQNGSILALQDLLTVPVSAEQKPDIDQILKLAEAAFEDFEHLPYEKILPVIVAFEARPRQRRHD